MAPPVDPRFEADKPNVAPVVDETVRPVRAAKKVAKAAAKADNDEPVDPRFAPVEPESELETEAAAPAPARRRTRAA
jgi:hypothetical protein